MRRRPEHDITFRKQAVARILPPKKEKFKDVARDLQISTKTLRRWRDETFFVSTRAKKWASKTHPALTRSEIERRVLELHDAGYSDVEIKKNLGSVSLPIVRQTITRHQEPHLLPGDSASQIQPSPKKQQLPKKPCLKIFDDLVTHKPEELNPEWHLWDQRSYKEFLRQNHQNDKLSTGRLQNVFNKLGVDTFKPPKKPTLKFTPEQSEDFLQILAQSCLQTIPLFKVALYEDDQFQMICALSKTRNRSFLLFQGTPTASEWINFFLRLCRTSQNGMAFVIMEHCAVLDAVNFKKWLHRNSRQIRIFVLKQNRIVEHGSALPVALAKPLETQEIFTQCFGTVATKIGNLFAAWTSRRNVQHPSVLSSTLSNAYQTIKEQAVARLFPPNKESLRARSRGA